MPTTEAPTPTTLYFTGEQLAAALLACVSADQVRKAVESAGRKALAEATKEMGLAGHSQAKKAELQQLLADHVVANLAEAPAAKPEPEAPAAPEAPAPVAGTIEAMKAEKAKAKAPKGTGAARAPKVQLGQLPEGATEGTCQVCGTTKPATKFPKAVVAGKRQPNLRADECRDCRDARRAGGAVAPVQGPEVPEAPEAGPELSAEQAAELAAADAEQQPQA